MWKLLIKKGTWTTCWRIGICKTKHNMERWEYNYGSIFDLKEQLNAETDWYFEIKIKIGNKQTRAKYFARFILYGSKKVACIKLKCWI